MVHEWKIESWKLERHSALFLRCPLFFASLIFEFEARRKVGGGGVWLG
jgi:hypothetical protein